MQLLIYLMVSLPFVALLFMVIALPTVAISIVVALSDSNAHEELSYFSLIYCTEKDSLNQWRFLDS